MTALIKKVKNVGALETKRLLVNQLAGKFSEFNMEQKTVDDLMKLHNASLREIIKAVTDLKFERTELRSKVEWLESKLAESNLD